MRRRTLALLQPFVAPGSRQRWRARGGGWGGASKPKATLLRVARCVALSAFLKWVEERTKISAE